MTRALDRRTNKRIDWLTHISAHTEERRKKRITYKYLTFAANYIQCDQEFKHKACGIVCKNVELLLSTMKISPIFSGNVMHQHTNIQLSTSVWIKKLTRLVYMNVCVRMPMPRCVLLLNVERHCDSRESKANLLKSMQRCTKPEWNKSPNICHDIIFNRSHNNYGLYELFWWIRLQIFPFSQKKNSGEEKNFNEKNANEIKRLLLGAKLPVNFQIKSIEKSVVSRTLKSNIDFKRYYYTFMTNRVIK